MLRHGASRVLTFLASVGLACSSSDGGGAGGGGAGGGGAGGGGGGGGAAGMAGGGASQGGAGGAAGGGGAMGADTTTPFPIDLGGTPGAPTTYKGLRLGLVDNGAPVVTAVDGVIGVVCISMSNGNQECGDFISKVDRGDFAGQIASGVRFVNCAVGGNAIEAWNDPARDAMLWDTCINTKIGARGVRADQVRVVWHKAADMNTGSGGMVLPPYPDPKSDYVAFQVNLTAFAARLAEKLPSVQAVYTSSRSYGGFANSAGRGEPLSFEEGLALDAWLAANKTAGGIWYGWGPYVWAPDCSAGKNGGGVCYVRDDYMADGVHPAQGARDKITTLLHARFGREAWYRP